MENKTIHYRHIFAWTGLIHILHTATKEDVEDIDNLKEMLLEGMVAAKHYKGVDKQIVKGYEEMLKTVPTLLPFYPELEQLLAER